MGIPLICSSGMEISLFGLERVFRFDIRSAAAMKEAILKVVPSELVTPLRSSPPSTDDLRRIHSDIYLSSLGEPATLGRAAGLPLLRFLPEGILDRRLAQPLKQMVGCTIQAVDLALAEGFTIGLGGGFHHARSDEGHGLHIYSDIAIAIAKAWRDDYRLNVLIIDLDTRLGDGLASIFAAEKRVRILDLHDVESVVPDSSSREAVDFPVLLSPGCGESHYLIEFERALQAAFRDELPGLIICLVAAASGAADPMRDLNLSADGIRRRDELMLKAAMGSRIPLALIVGEHSRSAVRHAQAESVSKMITAAQGYVLSAQLSKGAS